MDNVREEVLDHEDVAAILKELPEDIADAIEFMWHTGWRTSEALPLRWDQIDLDEGVLRWEVGTTKNKRGRTLAYDGLPELAELIQRRRAITDEVEREQERRIRWVFHRDGLQIKRKRFYHQWHAGVERAAYRGEGDLRKTGNGHRLNSRKSSIRK